VLSELTDIYKGFHQNSDAGLNDLIASVLFKTLCRNKSLGLRISDFVVVLWLGR